MAYNNDIPQPSDRVKISQSDLLENFATISALLGVDHVITPWTNPATGNQGKHNQVTIPEQGSDPTTAANEIALYCKEVSGTSQLFLRKESNGSVTDFSSLTTSTNERTTNLAAGLILKWGFTTGAALIGNSWNTVTFDIPFPTACLYVFVSGKVATAAPSTAQTTTLLILNSSFNKADFQVYNRRTDAGLAINADCYYFAIGN